MKPILFNTDMVRAILKGRKTVTRRVIKDKDIINAWDCESDGTPIAFIEQETGDSHPPAFPCQYQPGDILYVRETWNYNNFGWHYRADWPDDNCPDMSIDDKWRPSIHMPKEAARLFLRVTDVRVERLQEITSQGAFDEGAVRKPHYMRYGGERCLVLHGRYKQDFATLWDSTIKPADLPLYGWGANPWVWVIEFERVSKEAALKGGER